MVSDAPSVFERQPAVIQFISKIHTVWDDTKVLEEKFGDYLVEARKTGNIWYVASLNGETPKDITVGFSFLGEGSFTAQILKDGPNAEKAGTEYLLENININKTTKLVLPVAKGGGFVVGVE